MAPRRWVKIFLVLIALLSLTSPLRTVPGTASSPAAPPPPAIPTINDSRDYRIRLKSREFTPSPGVERELEGVMRVSTLARMHLLVQFYRIPTAAARAALAEDGIELLTYVPNRAWFASAPANVDLLKKALPGARWFGRILPEDKIAPSVRERGVGSWAVNPDETVNLWVTFFADVSSDEAKDVVGAHQGIVLDEELLSHRLVVRVPQEAIVELAREDTVQWIVDAPPPKRAQNDGSRAAIGANTLQAAPYNLDGNGVVAGEWDEGHVDRTHPDFITGAAWRVTYGDTAAVKNHSTHVGGTMGGDGSNSATHGGAANQWRGVAPAVKTISYDWNSNITEHNGAINTHGIRISQNSWGLWIDEERFNNCHRYGDYDWYAPDYDDIVTGRYDKRISVVFSVGNERNDGDCDMDPDPYKNYANITPPATAKNIIGVGATNSDTDSMTDFSSWGPVDDGRIKPDVVAPGDEVGGDRWIKSTLPGGKYGLYRGTSMAAPAVSGSAALILQRYGDICATSGVDPLPSTIKALLMHTAKDLGNAGPDYQFGYGRINAKEAVDMIPHHEEGTITNTGQVDIYNITIANRDELKVTLVWDDEPATANVSPTLMNDLDLVLIDPEAFVHSPWILNPANPSASATKGADHLNNVEQVVVDNPLPGQWQIQVRGFSIPSGPQPYSLVADPIKCGHCKGTPATDVYIKDHGTDTGTVPSNPNKEAFWVSPDIWVRNRKDGGTTHQNPEYGQWNYVYARIHNTGINTAYSVDVYLYWAKWSPAFTWPDKWNLMGRRTIANLPAGQTKTIAPIPWWPPGTGHYCLFARLVTCQDPITKEGNVPGDNNIGMKNVSIVDLQPNKPFIDLLTIAYPREVPGPMSLIIRREGFPPMSLGDVVVDVGLELYSRMVSWEGAEKIGETTKFRVSHPLSATLTFEPMEPWEMQTITTELAAQPGDEAAAYRIDIEEEIEGETEGGVTYNIRTPATPLISQVYYDPADTEDDNEFIELYNPYNGTAYLAGLIVTDEESDGNEGVFQFPGQPGERNYPLLPGQRIIIASDAVDDGGGPELSAANWEFWSEGDDYDNPEVPNVERVSGESTEVALYNTGDGVMIATGAVITAPIPITDVLDGMTYENPATLVYADTNATDANAHPGCAQGWSLRRKNDGAQDTNDSANDFEVISPILPSDMGIAVTALEAVPRGTIMTYTISYSNTGVIASTGVVITADLPSEVRYITYTSSPSVTLALSPDPLVWDVGAVSRKAQGTIEMRVLVSETVSLDTIFTTSVEVGTDAVLVEGNPNNDQDSMMTTVGSIDVSLNKMATTTAEEEQFSTEVIPGGIVTYVIHYVNQGDLPAQGAMITDVLPSEVSYLGHTSTVPITLTNQPNPLVWELETVSAKANESIVINVVVPSTVTFGVVLTNTAEITMARDYSPTNNVSTASVRVIAPYGIYLPVIMKIA